MITTISMILILWFYKKHTKKELSTKKQLMIILSSLILVISIIQILLLTNSIYVLSSDSSMSATAVELVNKNGYVGEKNEKEFVFYQNDKDLVVKNDDLDIQESSSESLTKLDITSKTKVDYSNNFAKFLINDFYFFKDTDKDEKEETSTVYVLYKTENLKIKNMN